MVDFNILQTPDYFGGAVNAMKLGEQARQASDRRNVLADTTTADLPNALLHIGDLQGAAQAQDLNTAADTAKYTAETRAANSAALARRSAVMAKLQANDPQGARAAAAGDPDALKLIDAASQHVTETVTALANLGAELKKVPYGPDRVALLKQQGALLEQRGLDPKVIDGFDPTDQNIDATVQSLTTLADQHAASKPVSVAPGASLVDPTNPDKPLFTAPKEKVFPTGYQDDGKGGLTHITGGPADPKVLHANALAKHIASGGGGGVATPGAPLGFHQDTIDALAARYNAGDTSVLSGLGVGKNSVALKAQILNKATALAAADGSNPRDVLAARGDLKAAATALTNLTKLRTTVEAFEGTALKNADLALKLSAKGGGPTGAPVLNRWIQSGRKNVAGDPDVAAFNLALGTLTDEYAKVVTGGGGNQASTDSARNEAARRIDAASSPAQLQAVIKTMKQEMGNRTASMKSEEAQLHSNLSGRPSADGSAPASAQQLTPEQAQHLPAGAHFIGTDGVARVKH